MALQAIPHPAAAQPAAQQERAAERQAILQLMAARRVALLAVQQAEAEPLALPQATVVQAPPREVMA